PPDRRGCDAGSARNCRSYSRTISGNAAVLQPFEARNACDRSRGSPPGKPGEGCTGAPRIEKDLTPVMRATIFKSAIVCFEALLLVVAQRFRATYGNEMVLLFRCRLERAARRSLASLLFCATAGLVDLAITGVLQRFSERRASPVPRLPAPKGDPLMNRITLNVKLTL